MQVYLVGGAVRDQLLGRAIAERDYVVVGSTPAHMLAQGFIPVGRDFPVFLHPQTKEEYALARTERKSGVGYAGFTFFTSPDLSLEDDLIRRDLTINAMAMAEDGTIIDPHGGQADLANRVLRHVSPAFAEDPLRVLRVARFAARYAPLGFQVAPDTLALMRQLVQRDELRYLSPERIWKETQRALTEPHAGVYIEVLRACGALARILPELDALFGVPQRAESHPEIDCGLHTLMCLQQACQAGYATRVRFAVLLHDVGKALTPPGQLPSHAGHELRGLASVTALCQRLMVPAPYQQLAELVCTLHLRCHQALNLPAADIWQLLHQLDALRRPDRAEEFIQACACDARGRLGFEVTAYPQADYLRQCIEAVRAVRAADLPGHFTGQALGQALNAARINAIAQLPRASLMP